MYIFTRQLFSFKLVRHKQTPTEAISKLEVVHKVWDFIPTIEKLLCKPCGFMINFGRRVKTQAEDHIKAEKQRNHGHT